MIKAVFVDIDNTLLDFDGYVKESMRSGFEKFGYRSFEPWMFDIFTRENDKLWEALERKEITFRDIENNRFNIILSALDISGDGPAFEKYFRKCIYDSAIPVAGAMEMIRELYGKYILCAASNGPGGQQEHRLSLAGMEQYMDYCFISEAMGASKPSKDYFEKAFAVLNEGRDEPILPGECCIVGDSLTSDIKGGKDYGMKTIYYCRKQSGLGAKDPDAVITSLFDAANAICSLDN